MQPPQVQYANTRRGDIAYQVVGEGPLDLLLINPMSRTIDGLWDYPANAALLERLARLGRLIVFDRRGSGLSDPLPIDLPPTWEDWMDDVLAVLDAAGSNQVAIVAERDAAAAGLSFASSHPERVRALVLCNTSARFRLAPGYPIGESHERADRLSQQWQETWGTERMVAATRPSLANDPEYVNWVIRMQRAAYSPRRAAAEFRYLIDFDARAVMPAIQAPTLVLHRRDMPVVPVAHGQYVAEHIAGAQLELLPGSDMDVLVPGDEQPLALIEAFLSNVRPAAYTEHALATVLKMRVADSRRIAAYRGGSRWLDTLDQFAGIVRDEAARCQARSMPLGSDGYLLGFDGPARGLRFAASVRQMLREQLRIEVRMGVHVGECERRDDAIAGDAAEVAAGVFNAACAGEILATAAVTDLVGGSGIALRSIGSQQLDGIPGEWALYALDG